MTMTSARYAASAAGTTTETATGLPVARKATILGLALYSVAMALAVVATVLIGVGFMTVFFAVNLAVCVALMGLVWRFGAWGLERVMNFRPRLTPQRHTTRRDTVGRYCDTSRAERKREHEREYTRKSS